MAFSVTQLVDGDVARLVDTSETFVNPLDDNPCLALVVVVQLLDRRRVVNDESNGLLRIHIDEPLHNVSDVIQ